jgi:hypothetical protein
MQKKKHLKFGKIENFKWLKNNTSFVKILRNYKMFLTRLLILNHGN